MRRAAGQQWLDGVAEQSWMYLMLPAHQGAEIGVARSRGEDASDDEIPISPSGHAQLGGGWWRAQGSRVFRGAQQSRPVGSCLSLRHWAHGQRRGSWLSHGRRWSTGPRRGPGPGEHALRVHGVGFFPVLVLAVVVLYWQWQGRWHRHRGPQRGGLHPAPVVPGRSRR